MTRPYRQEASRPSRQRDTRRELFTGAAILPQRRARGSARAGRPPRARPTAGGRSRISATRVTRPSARSRSCVASDHDRAVGGDPPQAIGRRCATARSSRPVNGSSNRTSRGRCSSARSSARRCRMPREKPLTGSSARSARPARLERRVDQAARVEAVQLGEKGEVLARGELGIQVQLVREQADAAPQRRAERARGPVAVAHLAAGRRRERRQHRDQRRLAGAVRAEQADDLAGPRASAKCETTHGGARNGARRREAGRSRSRAAASDHDAQAPSAPVAGRRGEAGSAIRCRRCRGRCRSVRAAPTISSRRAAYRRSSTRPLRSILLRAGPAR